MQIAGIQKLTLVDFPDHVAATVFARGCSFRCGFCHNPELVLPDQFNPLLSEKQIFDFLETRYGKLTGICITGGEPCMQKDIDKFISHMKALGFDVKLDTNGSFPDKLEQIIQDGDVDYIAMDIKGTLEKYPQISNYQLSITNQSPNSKSLNEHSENDVILSNHSSPHVILSDHSSPHVILSDRREPKDPVTAYSGNTDLVKKIQRSIKLIMESGIPYEFRTTICHPLHEVADFEKMGEMIKGADKYFLQNFVKSKHINEAVEYMPFTDAELVKARKIMAKSVKEVGAR